MVERAERYYTIDLFRILFCMGVVIGHAYCILFQKNYVAAFGSELSDIHIMCVDGFFMISGVFMARHFYFKEKEIDYKIFMDYHIKRYIRLLLPLIFVCLVVLAGKIVRRHFFGFSRLLNHWSLLLLLSGTNTFHNHFELPSWYVDSLFWMGLLVSFFLCFFKKKSLIFIFPFAVYLSLSYMHVYNCLSLGNSPRVWNFFSVGNIRAVAGLCMGAELFYMANKFNEKCTIHRRGGVFVIEIFSVLGLLFCFTRGGIRETEFLIYPFFSMLLFIFLIKKEVLFSWCKVKPVAKVINFLAPMTYIIYLSHVPLLNQLKPFFEGRLYLCRNPAVYAVLVLLAVALGVLLHWLEKVFERILFCIAQKFVMEVNE